MSTIDSDDALIEALRALLQVEPRRPVRKGDTPNVHPVAPQQTIALAESKLGFRLPELVQRLYAEVADGGFGPAYGILPVASHYDEPGQSSSVIEVRDELAVDPTWPSQLLALCDWGCANWSCLDCRTQSGPVVTLAGENGFFDTGRDLRSWLSAWLAGTDLMDEMFEERTTTGINPFTRKAIEIRGHGAPRGRRWP